MILGGSQSLSIVPVESTSAKHKNVSFCQLKIHISCRDFHNGSWYNLCIIFLKLNKEHGYLLVQEII